MGAPRDFIPRRRIQKHQNYFLFGRNSATVQYCYIVAATQIMFNPNHTGIWRYSQTRKDNPSMTTLAVTLSNGKVLRYFGGQLSVVLGIVTPQQSDQFILNNLGDIQRNVQVAAAREHTLVTIYADGVSRVTPRPDEIQSIIVTRGAGIEALYLALVAFGYGHAIPPRTYPHTEDARWVQALECIETEADLRHLLRRIVENCC